MIRALGSLLAVMMATPTAALSPRVTTPLVSPCPNVFTYDTTAVEPNKWNGVVTLTTEIPLYALWLNIVLDNKANILGNWVGEVTTDDNIDFKIENTKMTIKPGTLAVPFFIQYKAGDIPPKLVAIRFNGKEICQVETTQVSQVVDPVRAISYEEVRPEVTVKTTVEPTVPTTSRNYNKQQTTKSQYWYQRTTPAPTTTTAVPSQYWTEARTTESALQTTRKNQYWQQTTSTTTKPVYWTQATTEVKSQTTERSPVWSYGKGNNNQEATSAVKPTNQTWSQSRPGLASRTTTELSSGSKVQSWSSTQTQTKDRNRTENFQAESQVPYNQQTTVSPQAWPNVVAGNQKVSSSGTRLNNTQIEVKQIGQTKYWSKIPSDSTGSPVKVHSGTENTSYGWSDNSQRVSNNGLQNEPYAKVSIKQAESLPPQNYDQATDTPLYVRPGDRQTVSSTYDADTRPGYSGVGSENSQPATSYQPNTGEYNVPKPSQSSWSGDGYDTWVDPAKTGTVIQSGVDSSGYRVQDGGIKTIDESSLAADRLATQQPAPALYKIEQYDSNSKQEEYYDGGVPVLYIPDQRPQLKNEPTCGKVILNKDRGINLKSTDTLEGQWPWQIALYQQQTSVDFRYICGGTLVSKRHVITAAHCVTKKKTTKTVDKNTLTVYLGKHNLRNSVEGVQVKFVNRILIYPEYDASTFKTDLAILELRETVTYSDRVQPICLWPEEETDLRHVVGKTGSIVGWGYEANGAARTQLTLLQMGVVDQETCIGSYADFFRLYTSERTYCAGYRNHGAACNGDSGGGMVFPKGDSWYLRGVVSLSVARQGTIGCDPSHYVIFTDVAKFRHWIQDNIEDYI
ncbi:hypothetical protein PYW07_008436 [Mythimna separata]|uniref:Peptidase S1 domain-containing protein n=1 Tax=Mythimna separata TaxID=271217 RepID=A0AAD7YCN5_MYTSE|nr:hypothetical protein PYW07_008436 [Mythimna separata]